MEAQVYVSKISRLEKVHRGKVTTISVTKYLKMRGGNRCCSPVRHFLSPARTGYTGRGRPFRPRVGGFA